MISLRNILFFVVILNVVLVGVLFKTSMSDESSSVVGNNIFLEQDTTADEDVEVPTKPRISTTTKSSHKHSHTSKPKTVTKTVVKTKYNYVQKYLKPKTSPEYNALYGKYIKMKKATTATKIAIKNRDIFKLLGAYPTVSRKYFNSYPSGRPWYNVHRYGVKKDSSYCALSDAYMLAHPENVFSKMNFFTDYTRTGLIRTKVMRVIGYDIMHQVTMAMPYSQSRQGLWHLKPQINMYFMKQVNMHINYKIGEQFLCATQMYNHIPGHGVLKRKDLVVNSVATYAARYKHKPQCFNKKMFFPLSYRLYRKDECKKFFNILNSAAYKKSLAEEPIQYLIKVGYGSHRANGVFLLDKTQSAKINKLYGSRGQKCGKVSKSLIAQTYVTNPLLLDLDNKFDFRVYMLVASTNPTIVYYHDGFLRVSLKTYNKNSKDRTTHLTNTHLSKAIFAKAADGKYNGKTEAELRDYQMWTLPELEEYLFESGKIQDRNWLANYLRPQFQRAFIHTVRMSEKSFWKGSNVFEMFGLDFMLDSDLNLWFIECNSSPQLIGTSPLKTNFLVKMLTSLFDIQYAYYRSRMHRVFELLSKINKEIAENQHTNYTQWRVEYKKAMVNRLEPQFEVPKNNSFILIMDRSKTGKERYFGHLPDECIDD